MYQRSGSNDLNHSGHVEAGCEHRHLSPSAGKPPQQKCSYPQVAFNMPKRVFNGCFAPGVNVLRRWQLIVRLQSLFERFIFKANDLAAFP